MIWTSENACCFILVLVLSSLPLFLGFAKMSNPYSRAVVIEGPSILNDSRVFPPLQSQIIHPTPGKALSVGWMLGWSLIVIVDGDMIIPQIKEQYNTSAKSWWKSYNFFFLFCKIWSKSATDIFLFFSSKSDEIFK